MEVISFDKDRVQAPVDNGVRYLDKKTSPIEVDNLKKAREYLESKRISVLGDKFEIEIPKVRNWDPDSEVVRMDFFEGKNLEELIRTISTRKDAVMLLNKLLDFILIKDFYWVDFSPRNILVNQEKKKICFVDFEKGLSFKNDDLTIFFRNHVYEEYSSFLLINERILSGKEIFKLRHNEEHINHDSEKIKVKRVKAMIKKLGYPDIITQDQFLEIYRLFMMAEVPEEKDGKIIFPRIELEDILETKKTNPEAYNQYADKIVQLTRKKKINY